LSSEGGPPECGDPLSEQTIEDWESVFRGNVITSLLAVKHAGPPMVARGGGSIILMDLPLPESIQQRVDAGMIVRVNEDGSAWSDSDPTPEPVSDDAVELARDDVGPVRPDRAMPKATSKSPSMKVASRWFSPHRWP